MRIHFTVDDLARTAVAEADPLWEIVFSGFRLRERNRLPVFRSWLRHAQPALDRSSEVRQGAAVLALLAPLGPYFPDFLTPPEACDGLAAGLTALACTPIARLRAELLRLATYNALPDWVRRLADGDVESLDRLCTGLHAYHRALIAPHHDLIASAIHADRQRRACGFLDGGIDGLLSSLGPRARWRPPVLEVDYLVDQDLHLAGRGLRLVPSYFCVGCSVTLADQSLDPVLVYPIDQDCRWSPERDTHRQSLAALLGSTRAEVLGEVRHGMSTNQLARRLGISPASVSGHTKVLRDAGLIVTRREGASVLHVRTTLGTALVDGR